MIQTARKKLIDIAEVRHSLAVLIPPDQEFEIRVLKAKTNLTSEYEKTLGGYFDDIEAAIKALSNIKAAFGFYITLQQCHQDLLHRAYNKLIKQESGSSTPDKYITDLRWLMIDSDPERLSLISATDSEKERALAISKRIREDLQQVGWPEPILADSGNGSHLLYRVNLPPEDASLVKRVLEGLAKRYNVPGINIDQSVFNPSRLVKLYGTLACKGDDTPTRPFRMSRLLEIPTTVQPVSRALLEAIAIPEPALAPIQPWSTQNTTRIHEKRLHALDLDAWLSKHGIQQ